MSDIDPQALRDLADLDRSWRWGEPELLLAAADTIEAHEQAIDWQAAIIRALLDDQDEARAEVARLRAALDIERIAVAALKQQIGGEGT